MEALFEKLKLIPPAKLAVIGVFAAVLTLAGWLGLRMMYSSDYEVLYASLSSEDAGRIVEKLKETKVKYRLNAAGTSIMVPSENVAELRLSLASQGLPTAGGVGFELFDKTKLGISGFAEKIQSRRALEGELGRTLAHMDGVKSARVHLALPEPTPFVTEQPGARASVILHLAPGAALTAAQIRGVVHMVSGAVEGLAPESVSVLDGMGRLLHGGGDDEMAGASAEMKTGIEKALELRGQELMDRLYGKDKALVRVDAAIDMDKLQSVKESYDPDTELIRNSREVTEKGGTAGGHNETQTSYELNKTMETFVKTPGGIKKLSVAVLVSDAKATPEQIGKIKETIAAALGVDEERGDKLTVETMEFAPAVQGKETAEDTAWQKDNDRRELLRDVIRHGSLLLSALVFAGALFMAVKTAAPALAAVAAAAMATAVAAAPAPAASAASAAPAAAPARSREPGESAHSTQLTLSSMASEQPEVFSRAIKKFMSSPAAKNSPQKEAAGVN